MASELSPADGWPGRVMIDKMGWHVERNDGYAKRIQCLWEEKCPVCGHRVLDFQSLPRGVSRPPIKTIEA